MISNRSISHEEYLRKKRKRKLIKFWLFLFLVCLIVGLSSYLSHRQEIRISKVILSGGELVTEEEVGSLALAYMRGSYLLLYPKNNALWYPHNNLEEYLKENFQRIEDIDIKRDGFNTIKVSIKERKPFAIWCDIKVTEIFNEDTDDCYFMDQNSTVFAKAPSFSGDAYFKYYGLLPQGKSPIGKEYIASSTLFRDISGFILKAKELNIKPLYVVAKEDDQFSLFLSGGVEVFFDTKESLSIVGENLEVLLRTPIFASSTGDLPVEYIDLRYGNKLFYKLKK